MYIRDNEASAEEFEAMPLPFTVPSAYGQEVQLSSKHSHISLENRSEYVRLAINYRCASSTVTYLIVLFSLAQKQTTIASNQHLVPVIISPPGCTSLMSRCPQ